MKGMPFAFCTREKNRWCEMAEDAESGCSIEFLKRVRNEPIQVFILTI